MGSEWDRILAHLQGYGAETGVILGSGLSPFTDSLTDIFTLPYTAIPGMPPSAVKGHTGALVAGFLEGTPVITMSGRIHAYEGYTPSQVAFPVDLLATIGVSTLITTSAVGAVNPTYKVGDIMLVKDHINLIGGNPLTGADLPTHLDRFVPMSEAYNPELRSRIYRAAQQHNIPVRVGVLAATLGPSYETVAEVRMLHLLGADATGMSVVFETIRARWHGMKVAALSAITNKATGVDPEQGDSHNHASVVAEGQRIADTMVKLVGAAVQNNQ